MNGIFNNQGVNNLSISPDLHRKVDKVKMALESLMNVKAFGSFIRKEVRQPTGNEQLLTGIAFESICNQINVSTSTISFEDIMQQSPEMATIESNIEQNLIDSISDLIPTIYSDITNFSLVGNSFISTLNKIERDLKSIPEDKLKLIENLQPIPEYIYLYTSKGISLNAVVNTPTTFYEKFISDFDNLVFKSIEWGYNTSKNNNEAFVPFKDYFVGNDFTYPDLPGLVDLKLTVTSGNGFPEAFIQLTEIPGSSNLASDFATQSKLNAEQWMEFNKNGRREDDDTVLPALSLGDMEILVAKLKELHAKVIQSRIDINEKLFINKNEDGVIPFTFVLDAHAVSGKMDPRSYEILKTILNAISLRNTVDRVLTQYCFNLINTLNALLEKNINFYNY